MPDFSQLALPVNLAIFCVGAIVVWIAGSLVATYAGKISARTGLGEAFIGLILLSAVTSLPELATTIAASASGASVLAANNLLGSIAMQVALLALVDAVVGRDALTSIVPDAIVMLQGALNICLLCIVAVGSAVGDIAFIGGGVWTLCCAVGAVLSIWILSRARGRTPWVASLSDNKPGNDSEAGSAGGESVMELALPTVLAATAILVAGSAIALSGDAIANQSGIGGSFMGFAFVAIATSLPEASATVSAVRSKAYTLAISGILGTNILNVGLLFVVDLIAGGGPVLNSAGKFGVVAALLGAIVTSVFLAGIAERRNRTFFRMGYDSLAVLGMYSAGLALLFSLRETS